MSSARAGKGRIDNYNKAITAEQRKENAKKAGVASGKARVQKQLLRDALNAFLDARVSDCSFARDIALQYGITSDVTIKTLFVVSCTLNTMKSGTIKDLDVLMNMLKENEHEEISPNLKALIDAVTQI